MLWVSGKPDGHQRGELAASDEVAIPYRRWWRPNARAVLLYMHGQGDHSGPFAAMGDAMYDMGFNVYAHDHRGFGLSRWPRGDIVSYDQYIDDARLMIEHVRQENPAVPVFLLGLSMGGHIALRTAYKAGSRIRGAIALSPGFRLKRSPPLAVVLRTALYALFSPTRLLPTVTQSVVTTRNQYHLDRAMADEHWVTAYTARFYMAAVRSIRKARQELRRIQVPVLMMQAGQDNLTCPDTAKEFFHLIGHTDKEFRLLDGLYHNLVVEPEMPTIAREIAAWVDRRIDPGLRVV